jgi:hypothetical protein
MNAIARNEIPSALLTVVDASYDTEHGRGWLSVEVSSSKIDELICLGLAERLGQWPRLTVSGLKIRN